MMFLFGFLAGIVVGIVIGSLNLFFNKHKGATKIEKGLSSELLKVISPQQVEFFAPITEQEEAMTVIIEENDKKGIDTKL